MSNNSELDRTVKGVRSAIKAVGSTLDDLRAETDAAVKAAYDRTYTAYDPERWAQYNREADQIAARAANVKAGLNRAAETLRNMSQTVEFEYLKAQLRNKGGR